MDPDAPERQRTGRSDYWRDSPDGTELIGRNGERYRLPEERAEWGMP
jgi:hypothetical protein